ncbi:hypothetical protein [Nonomuraea indica]|uniref:Uncharacterized protein n=1 Tax=Nonomuraea indica TaxID=1581193 RepID=A0ABW7ZZG4_9ACTN
MASALTNDCGTSAKASSSTAMSPGRASASGTILARRPPVGAVNGSGRPGSSVPSARRRTPVPGCQRVTSTGSSATSSPHPASRSASHPSVQTSAG